MGLFDKIAVADGTQLLLGRGAIFFDRFSTAGAKQGANFLGNATVFEIGGSSETRQKRGMVDNTNPLLANVLISGTLNVNLTLSEYRKEQLAIGLFGDVAYYTQTNTPIVAEQITPTSASVQGRVYFTAKKKVGSYTVKVGASTKAEGTDYEIDTETGAVYIKPGGSIADGSTVTIDYTPATITGTAYPSITPGTAGVIRGEMRFVGKPMQGKIHEVVLWKVTINPAGAVALLSEDFSDFQLSGMIESDAVNHAAEPFGHILQY